MKLVQTATEAVADESGSFQFYGVPLLLGSNALTAEVQVFDAAGNAASTTINLTRAPAAGTIFLAEGNQLLVEASTLVDLGQSIGSRTVSIPLDARFDNSDQQSIAEDTLLIYLVDPTDPTQTLLSSGSPGSAIFSLADGDAEYLPGLVSYDGSVVEIDVTSLGGLTQGELVFQLLNTDSDLGTQVAIGAISSIVTIRGSGNPTFPRSDDALPVGPC